MNNQKIAETILAQLGGNRFRAMTGARNFIAGQNGELSFRIPVSRGINHVRVQYDAGRDLYDMRFAFVRAGKVHTKADLGGVYADQLQSIFTSETGLYTHL